ncbi:hypothetical protein KUCAC02_037209, partial [Chaenocephalus aceratus]
MSAAGRLPEGLGSGAGRSLTNGDVVIGPWRLCDLMVTRSGPLGPVKPDVLLSDYVCSGEQRGLLTRSFLTEPGVTSASLLTYTFNIQLLCNPASGPLTSSTSAAHINLHLSFLYEELNLDLLPSERTTLREQRLGAWLLDVLIEGPHNAIVGTPSLEIHRQQWIATVETLLWERHHFEFQSWNATIGRPVTRRH